MKSSLGIGTTIVAVIIVVIIVVAGVGAYLLLGQKPQSTTTSSSSLTLTSSSAGGVTTSSSTSLSSSSSVVSNTSSASSFTTSISSMVTSSNTSSSQSNTNQSSSPFSLLGASMALNVNTQTGVPLNMTNLFFTNDSYALSWLEYSNPLQTSHNITWVWLTPSSSLFYNVSYIVSAGSGKGGEAWSYIPISGKNASTILGEWKVNVYIDRNLSMTASQTFSINATSSYPSIRFTMADAAISPNFNSTSHILINRTLSIMASDSRAYSWLNFTYVKPPAHNVTWIWLEPNGTQYFNSTGTIPDPGTGNEWASYSAWDSIYVQGHAAAQITGVWKAVIYVDGVKVLEQTFTIS